MSLRWVPCQVLVKSQWKTDGVYWNKQKYYIDRFINALSIPWLGAQPAKILQKQMSIGFQQF